MSRILSTVVALGCLAVVSSAALAADRGHPGPTIAIHTAGYSVHQPTTIHEVRHFGPHGHHSVPRPYGYGPHGARYHGYYHPPVIVRPPVVAVPVYPVYPAYPPTHGSLYLGGRNFSFGIGF